MHFSAFQCRSHWRKMFVWSEMAIYWIRSIYDMIKNGPHILNLSSWKSSKKHQKQQKSSQLPTTWIPGIQESMGFCHGLGQFFPNRCSDRLGLGRSILSKWKGGVGWWSSERVAGVMVDFFGGYLMIFYLKKTQRLRGIGILYLPTLSINLSQI